MIAYMASPYSDPDPAVRKQRFQDACRAAAKLIHAGWIVYAPIVHSVPLEKHGLPSSWGFWRFQDQALLEKCDLLIVLMLPGWQDSVGVAGEIQIARELGMPIDYLEPSLLQPPATPTLAHVATEVRS